MSRQEIREEIFKLLFRVEFNDNEEMSEQLSLFFSENEIEISDTDTAYITEKYEKIVSMISEIDALIDAHAKSWPTGRMGKVDLTILRLAVYEAKYDDSIPVGVAIDQAVELAKKYGQDGSASFINGVLSGVVK